MENKKSNRLFFKKIKDTDIEKLKSILQNKRFNVNRLEKNIFR